MTMNEIAIVVSLGLTVVLLGYAGEIIKEWWPSLKLRPRLDWPSERWLILGIFAGFLSVFLDNLFWGWVWALQLYESPLSEAAFDAGVYSNIPMRQMLGLFAAYCHLRAAFGWNDKDVNTRYRFYWLYGAGVALFLVLTA